MAVGRHRRHAGAACRLAQRERGRVAALSQDGEPGLDERAAQVAVMIGGLRRGHVDTVIMRVMFTSYARYRSEAMPALAAMEIAMTKVTRERVCAEPDKEIVVFLIGMRINKLWKVWRWLPVAAAMPRMLKELAATPELGMIAAFPYFSGRGPRDDPNIGRASRSCRTTRIRRRLAHQPAWRRFNEKVGTSGDVGIWHETYLIPAGNSESVYVNMPHYGLGSAAATFPAKGARANAAKRLARRVGGTP